MEMHLFYTPGISGNYHILEENESKHSIRVLRLKKGDKVVLVDGTGGWYTAEIVDENPEACALTILSKEENHQPLPYALHIGIAPTKNMDRFEWFLEKATEIGIHEITPILCKHSERRQLRHDRLEKILVAAMKQSLKAYKPFLHPLTNFSDWIKTGFGGTKTIGYCSNNETEYLWDMPLKKNLIMAIGPEGDFSQEEVKEAIRNKFTPVSLGNSRLRTETAGVVTCAIAQILYK